MSSSFTEWGRRFYSTLANYQTPRSWAERAFPNLIHYNKLDKGGYFATWEHPKLFTEELRAGFRSLRKSL